VQEGEKDYVVGCKLYIPEIFDNLPVFMKIWGFSNKKPKIPFL